MLAYTAGDGLQAIARTYGVAANPTIIERMERPSRVILTTRLARFGRALNRWLCL